MAFFDGCVYDLVKLSTQFPEKRKGAKAQFPERLEPKT